MLSRSYSSFTSRYRYSMTKEHSSGNQTGRGQVKGKGQGILITKAALIMLEMQPQFSSCCQMIRVIESNYCTVWEKSTYFLRRRYLILISFWRRSFLFSLLHHRLSFTNFLPLVCPYFFVVEQAFHYRKWIQERDSSQNVFLYTTFWQLLKRATLLTDQMCVVFDSKVDWSSSMKFLSVTRYDFFLCFVLLLSIISVVHTDDDTDYEDDGGDPFLDRLQDNNKTASVSVKEAPYVTTVITPTSSHSVKTTTTSTSTSSYSESPDSEDDDLTEEDELQERKERIRVTRKPFEVEGESLSKLQKFMLGNVETILKDAMPLILRSGLETNVSASCASSLLNMVSALRESRIWAFTSKLLV